MRDPPRPAVSCLSRMVANPRTFHWRATWVRPRVAATFGRSGWLKEGGLVCEDGGLDAVAG
jgi:hypothetical protein